MHAASIEFDIIDPVKGWDCPVSETPFAAGSSYENVATHFHRHGSVEDTDDIDMDSEVESGFSEGGWPNGDKVVLIGSDNIEVACSTEDIFHRSGKLWELLTAEGGHEPRVFLPLRFREIQLLSDSLRPCGLGRNYWDSADLKELVRSLELFLHYDVYDWDVEALEEAILERMRDGPLDDEPVSRFDMTDEHYVTKLRCSAERAEMGRLAQYIDRQLLYQIAHDDSDGGRPRKWRKLTINCAVASFH